MLHAHLPWVKRGSFDAVERWYHEALWECYLPLLAMLWRQQRDGVASLLTLSLSPPLLAMMSDPVLAGRFGEHMAALKQAIADAPIGADLAAHYARLHDAAWETWTRCQARPAQAFADLARSGRIELSTTAVSHAHLPALGPVQGARSQIVLGRWALGQTTGCKTTGIWLPECAIDDSLCRVLESQQITHTVVDSHALVAPAVRYRGVCYLARDEEARRRVWGLDGYPSHPQYREFHDDVSLRQSLGPFVRGTYSGIKDRAIGAEQPNSYRPQVAREVVCEHAADLVHWLSGQPTSTTTVAAFDAELFGHWWHEGITFLDQVLRRIAQSANVRACRLVDCAEDAHHSDSPPGASSWGLGGHHQSWIGPRSARYWRQNHRIHRAVRTCVRRQQAHAVVAARAWIRALASDWLFMLEHNILPDLAKAELDRVQGAVWQALDDGEDRLDGLWSDLAYDTLAHAFDAAER